jgi:ribose-phosphate pyrophosphokinase
VKLSLLSGTANRPLAGAIAARFGCDVTAAEVARFPDGELHVDVMESVRGRDVFIVQPTGPPADANLMELLLLADACRRAGADRLTAVIPYFGYARQDRRATGREAVAVRVVGDLLQTAGFGRVVGVDMHTASIEAILSVPLEHLSAVPLLAEAVKGLQLKDGVVVAPDLGATKLAERFGRLLGMPIAVVRKTRVSGEAVTVGDVVGEVGGRTPVIVDDMISTGGTIEAAVRATMDAGSAPEVTVVATHALLVGRAGDRLRDLPLRNLLVTDSVPPPDTPLPMTVIGLDTLLAEAIRRIHADESIGELVRREPGRRSKPC